MVKRLLGLCILVLAASWAVSLPVEGARAPQQASWTFMVYMAADNNLEDAGIDDFLEMAVAGSNADLNILVQFDRIPGYDTRYGDWRSTKRFRVTPGMTPDPQNALMDIGEANMGDPNTVIDFVNWARANYPADHYALVFWNHGGGWLSDLQPRPDGVVPEDFCWDDTNGGDAITSAELYQSLDSATGGGVTPIDQVGFDACLMGMWEVDNQIKPFGSAVSVSSEELEPWDGWPYDTILTDLKANPGWTPAQLGYDIVQRYYESYGNDETQSAKDVAAAYTALNEAVDGFAHALIAFEPAYHNQYNTARSAAQDFGSDFIDLYDLALKIKAYVPEPELHAAADTVMDAVDAAIVHERHGPSWPGAHGISFYFPSHLGGWAAYKALQSSALTHWDEFVEYHITGQPPCGYVQIEDVTYTNDGLAVTLDSTVSGEAPIDYLWSFGDGDTSALPKPTHTYPANGTYSASLEVSNCEGDGSDGWAGPVALEPEIVVDPLALEATLYPDEVTTATLWLTNDGVVDLSFALHETGTLVIASAAKQSPSAGPADLNRALRPRADPIVDPQLAAQVRAEGQATALIYLRELPDLSPAYGIAGKAERRQWVYDQLKETAMRSGGKLYTWLEAAGAEPRRLLVANAIAATVDSGLLAAVAVRPEVARVSASRVYRTEVGLSGSPGSGTEAVEWNIAQIRADDAWSTFGVTGQGAVVGEIDTGVMYDHPALVNQYRGNLGDGTFDHNYNWFDFVDGLPAPYDPIGHGTFGMGFAVGNDGGANQIGVAPGARWIAVKACNGSCTDLDLLAAAQWMLAPTRLDGTGADPTKAPDLVLNMWGGGGCDQWFEAMLQAWRAADILPIFAPGGSGPGCMTVGYPAASAYAVSAGATDSDDLIAPFSARGPSACTGAIKPEVAAPGVNVRSSSNDGGYQIWSGTSFSTAHLAGMAALVLSADPSLSMDQVMANIEETALCIEDLSCGGTPCPDGANNVYGWGRIDAYEAVSLTMGGLLFDLPWLSEAPTAGVISPSQTISVVVTFDSGGLEPGLYTGLLDVESDDPETPHLAVSVTLTVEPPPVCYEADILAVIYEKAGCQVTFSAQVTGTTPISPTWDFGSYGTYTVSSPTVDFGVTGSYTGTLTVENCDGLGHDVQALAVDVECVTLRRIYIPLVVKNF